MEIKVRKVDSGIEKSQAELEAEIIAKAEEKQEQEQQENEEPEKKPGQDPEQTPDEDVEEQEVALTQEQVLEFINNRYDNKVTSLEDLLQKREETPELPAEVTSYMEFRKNTGRGFDDFVKLNKDYSEVSDENILVDHLLATEKGIDRDDAIFLLEKYKVDEDMDEPREKRQKELDKKLAVSKAREYFNELKEMYATPLESGGGVLPEDVKTELDGYRQAANGAKDLEAENLKKSQWFDKKSDELFNADFKGFEVELGENKILFNPGSAEEIKKANSNIWGWLEGFLDEKGYLTDAKGFHRALAIAMNSDEALKLAYEQGKADAVEDGSRQSKNIRMDVRSAPEVTRTADGLQVKSLTSDHGNRLVIRSKNKK